MPVQNQIDLRGLNHPPSVELSSHQFEKLEPLIDSDYCSRRYFHHSIQRLCLHYRSSIPKDDLPLFGKRGGMIAR